MCICLLVTHCLDAKLYIAIKDTKVRSGKGNRYSVLGELKRGRKIEIEDTTSTWRKVEEDGVVGYINSKYLKETTPDAAMPLDAAVDDESIKDWIASHFILSIGGVIVILLIIRSVSLAISARRSENLAIEYDEKYKSLIKHWFQCQHCAATIKNDVEPSSHGCTKSKTHLWFNLGEVGQHKYHCKNCGTTVHTKMDPTDHGCPKATLHRWVRIR